MEPGPEPEPIDPSDTLLGRLLAELERDGDAALERIRHLEPALAQRVMTLIARLRDVGILREPLRIGRFDFVEPLGRGAMGIVWKARDPTLGRDVAVKVLAGHLLTHPTAIERFEREARVIAGLRHPGIVTVHEIGDEQGMPFLVMELVDGGSLADRIGAEHSSPPPTDEICRLGVVLCDALHVAHQVGVVHRDIKPSNVLLRASGAPLLGDFGLACIDGDPSLTVSGDMLGTPAYAAPEMLESGRADARSDVYSLGATLFCALTGRPPFEEGSVQALMRRVATSEAPRLRSIRPDLPIDLESVMGRALEHDPSRRYATAQEFGDDLGRILRSEPVRARRVGPLQLVLRWARRRPALATAVALPLALTIAFVIGFVWWQGSELRRYEQLADVRVVESLGTEVPELWPALPVTVPRMQRWLDRARGVLDRADLHRREKQRLEASAKDTVDGKPVFDDETLAWQHDVLSTLTEAIEQFRPLVPLVEARAAHAAVAEEQTVSGAEAQKAWASASAAIRASQRYGGLELRPQLGLLPLGEDPQSGLWEFWHPLTGTRPEPAKPGATSRWRIEPETGVVFVLIPGGTYTIGARPPSDEHPVGTPFVEPAPLKVSTRVEDVELWPYFLAKYEVTQAQWERLTGASPSQFDHRARPDLCVPSCPVESVAWEEVLPVVTAAGMTLPTDVQWEVAYRAGTTTVFPLGDDDESMYGAENFFDRSWERAMKTTNPGAEPFDDGFPCLSPVGSYAPNLFGMHDMAANVGEFCRDGMEEGELRPRPGDGLIGSAERTRLVMVRGASWSDGLMRAHCAFRDVTLRDKRTAMVGVRVARVCEQ